MSEPITHVYLVVYETDVSGAWTSPEEAVRFEFSYGLKEEGGVRLSHIDKVLTVEEAVEEMLKPNSDYPYLAKIKLDPSNDSEKWDFDR
jgi:hypothetical protein